jgi:hypothetical protein
MFQAFKKIAIAGQAKLKLTLNIVDLRSPVTPGPSQSVSFCSLAGLPPIAPHLRGLHHSGYARGSRSRQGRGSKRAKRRHHWQGGAESGKSAPHRVTPACPKFHQINGQ